MPSANIAAQVAAIRAHCDTPICVGFGISTPEQAADAARVGDGAIVGSHLVRLIEAKGAGDRGDLIATVAGRAAELAAAVHAVR